MKKLVIAIMSLGAAVSAWAGDALPLTAHPDSTSWPSLFKPDLSDAV